MIGIYTMLGDQITVGLSPYTALATAKRLAAERGESVLLAEGYSETIVRPNGEVVEIQPDTEIIRDGMVYVDTDAGETGATWIR